MLHSADGWKEVLDPVIARYANVTSLRFFRAMPPMPEPAPLMRGWREVG